MRASFFFVLLIALPLFAAASSQSFEDLKKQYLSLRNTDVKVERIDEWRNLAQKLDVFAEEKPASTDAPAALLYASILKMEAGKARADAVLLAAARSGLEAVVARFPRSDLADDALLYLANASHGESEISYYQRLIALYPSSDSAEVARARLSRFTEITGSTTASPPLNRVKPGTEVIILDPGHGGEDRGAVGGENLFEKDVALMVGVSTAEILEGEGYQVILTRDDDSFVPLSERTAMANAEDGAVFVSLHVNASAGGKRSGVETYILDASTDHAARLLAERENAASGGSEPGDVQVIVSDLVQRGKIRDSEKLAGFVRTSLAGELKAKKIPLADNGIRKAPFYVLVGTHMPCILLEMGYIDNEKEGGLLAEPSLRSALARGLSRGIIQYLESAK